MTYAKLDGTTQQSFQIKPLATSGAPAAGQHYLGELAVDAAGLFYRCTASGSPGTWVPLGLSEYSMTLLGAFADESLPLTDVGLEVALQAQTLSSFRAVREIAGSGGTTTIQLEVNGSPVTGATISWVPADGNLSAKSSGAFSATVVPGDRISFRVTSSETGEPENIDARVR